MAGRPEFDLAVVGAGIAGLSLALASARRGLSVCVVERDPDRRFRRQGFNLVLSDRSAEALAAECGLEDQRTKYDWCCDLDPWGWLPLTAQLKPSPMLSRFLRGFGAVRRGRFRDRMLDSCERAGVRVLYGHRLDRLEQSPERVTCRFAENEPVVAEVVAGCDGARSAVRAELLPGLRLCECGAVCVRGAAADDGSLSRLAGAPVGESLLMFVSCCPGTGFNATVFDGTVTWVLEINGKAVADAGLRPAILARCGRWHPEILRLMLEATPAESLYLEVLSDLGDQTGCTGTGRVTLLGDAAHPVTWTGGGNDAIADGVGLAATLAEHGLTPSALRAHEQAMAERNPVSKAADSRRGLPSYSPTSKVVWWWCWSLIRPVAYMANQVPLQAVRTLAFGGFELMR